MTAAHGPSAVAAVLVAGGSGQRLGAPVPKAFVEIEGDTLLELAARRFVHHARVGRVVVVVPSSRLDGARTLLNGRSGSWSRDEALDEALAEIERRTGRSPSTPSEVTIVAGGPTRQASVLAGLASLPATTEFVLVHDVARPFVPRAVISRVLAALADGADAAIPVLPVHDTIRRVDAAGELVGVVDRNELVAVQTPQGFRREALVAAHAAGEALQVTDDAALVEAMGGTVVAVPGADELFKITRPWDLVVAGAMLDSGALDG